MLILIKSHYKVLFKEIYSSIIEHDATTSKIPFYHFCLGSVYLDIVLKTFSMYARPIPVQKKCILKICNSLL